MSAFFLFSIDFSFFPAIINIKSKGLPVVETGAAVAGLFFSIFTPKHKAQENGDCPRFLCPRFLWLTAPRCAITSTWAASPWPCSSTKPTPAPITSSTTTSARPSNWSNLTAPWSGRPPICLMAWRRCNWAPSPTTFVFRGSILIARLDCIIIGTGFMIRGPGAIFPLILLGWLGG